VTITRAQLSTLLSLFITTLVVMATLVSGTARAGDLAAKREQARVIAMQVATLDQQLNAAVAEYGAAQQELAGLQSDISRTEHELATTEYQLALAEKILGDRAAALYKDGTTSLLDVLLSTRSFDELLTDLDYVRRMGERDADIVTTVERHRADLTRQREALDAQVAQAKQLVERQATRKAEIEAQLGQRREMLRGVKAQVADLVKAQQERARRAAVAEQASSGAASSGSSLAGSGQWWPVIRVEAGRRGISADGLYRLMMSESGGSATIVGGGAFYGLFQYYPSTWKGSWNPWRSRSITDGEAQIKATALAISMGKGPYWWPNTYPWAFSQ
jgi:peptidoglycan hydrolase CwlO-like protein